MFGLFASPRKKALKRAEVFFKNQFADLCHWDDQTIGEVLDFAAEIKRSSMCLSKEAEKTYENPFIASEDFCLAQLLLFEEKMTQWVFQAVADARKTEGVPFKTSQAYSNLQIKRAGLSVWYFSLVAACFPEFSYIGSSLWRQLKRGFDHCSHFDPEKDAIHKFINA